MDRFMKRPRTEIDYPNDISSSKEDGRTVIKGKNFPLTAGRSFLPTWQEKYDWLEYSWQKDATYCYYCRHFGAPKVGKASPFFADPDGFCNWKKAIQRFDEHAASEYHHSAASAYLEWGMMKQKGQSVASLVNKHNEKTIKENRHYLTTILECVIFCCKQGIALRGHREVFDIGDDPGQNPGNFVALTRLLSKYDEVVRQRLTDGPANARYLHSSIQNDLIASSANLIRRQVSAEVGECGAFSLICDEARDVSHAERLSLCVRYVYGDKIREEFLGFILSEKLDAASLTDEIFEALGTVAINPSLMVSQCYDGASVMSGAVSGVAQRVKERASPAQSAVYIHCFAHRVNLVVVQVCRAERFSGLFQTCQDLHHFLATSVVNPVFKKAQLETSPGARLRMVPGLSETRWTCQFKALDTLVVTMPAIFKTLEDFEARGGDRSGTAQGLLARLDSIYMVHLVTMRWVLQMTADVAESLQDKEHTLSQGLQDIDNVLTRLHRPILSDEDDVWNKLWAEAQTLIEDLGLPPLAARRRRRARADYDESGVGKDDFRKNMFSPLCKSVRFELLRRFKAPENVPVYAGVLALTPGSSRFLSEDDLVGLFRHYHPEETISTKPLKLEIALLRDVFDRGGEDMPGDLLSFYLFLKPQERVLGNTVELLKIALSLPIASATSERSFSTMRRIMTYLRNSTGDQRLSDLGVLNVARERLENLNLNEVIDHFAESNRRLILR